MNILAFSDLHCDQAAAGRLVEAAQAADLVIGAGDFAQNHEGLQETMAALAPIEAKALYVPGNNETLQALRDATAARILHGDEVEIDGVRIAGIGCAIPPLPPMPWGSYDMTEDAAGAVLAEFSGVDVLVSHSPPKGAVDVHDTAGSFGSVAVRDWVREAQPTLVLCGHIHDCWGQEAMISKTRVCNLGPSGAWFTL